MVSAWGDDEYVNGDCSNGAGNRVVIVVDAATWQWDSMFHIV